ncbi:MAG: permease [Prochloraceae cyanobacterium]|nr:permease [Prochloraceae cyanobacterium]
MNQLHNAFTLFLSLLVEAIPFLLLGVLLSSALLLSIDERKLIANLPKNPFLGALIGSCVGFLFPVCECGNVPVARRLLMQGVPTSVAISFLLAAPTINPIVFWSTWVAFRDQPEIPFLRLIFSLGIATFIGCVFSVQKDARSLLQPFLAKRLSILKSHSRETDRPQWETQQTPALLQSGTFIIGQGGQTLRMEEALPKIAAPVKKYTPKVSTKKLQSFIDNVVLELRELGGMLILGSAIAASIQTFVPRELVLSLGQSTISSIVAMMLLAAIVSICSTVDAFFVLSFASSFTTGSLLAFLVFGPTIDIKSVGLMLSIFRPRMILYIFTLVAQLTFILSLSYSYFF